MVEQLTELTPEQYIAQAGEAVEPIVPEGLKGIAVPLHPATHIKDAATVEGITAVAEAIPSPTQVGGETITYVEQQVPPDVSKLPNTEGRKWQRVWKNLRNRVKNAA